MAQDQNTDQKVDNKKQKVMVVYKFMINRKQQFQSHSKNKEEILKKIYCQLAKIISSRTATLQNIQITSIQYVEDLHLSKIVVQTQTNSDLSAMVEVYYDIYYDTMNIQSYLVRQFRPFSIGGHYEKILALRIMQKLNRFLQIYERDDQKLNGICFCLNPISGIPYLNCKLFLDKSIKDSALFLKETQNGIAQFIAQILTMLFDFKQFFDFLTNEGSLPPRAKFLRYVIRKKSLKEIKIMNEHLSEIAKFLDTHLENQYNFISNEKLTKDYFLANFLDFTPDVKKIFQFMQLKSDHIHKMSIHTVLEQIFDYSCSFIEEQIQKSIAQQIKILTDPQYISWQPIARGGFGLIEKAELSYQVYGYEDGRLQVSKRRGSLVKKSDCTKKKKIPREKQILSILKNDFHPNVMPYYICESSLYQNYIFSKYEPEQSLDLYLEANKKTISLNTLITFLSQIANGIFFLKEKKIVHLDLKPSNVIIAKNLKAKIADFGQAFYLGDDPSLHRQNHAFTVPYCPPEIFDSGVHFSSKIDVYSFGAIIYKCLYGDHIFRQRLQSNKFVKKLLKKEVGLYLSPERIQKYGMRMFLRQVTRLGLKCLRWEGSERPSIFYILILFRIYQHYLSLIVQ